MRGCAGLLSLPHPNAQTIAPLIRNAFNLSSLTAHRIFNLKWHSPHRILNVEIWPRLAHDHRTFVRQVSVDPGDNHAHPIFRSFPRPASSPSMAPLPLFDIIEPDLLRAIAG
jgi:hypothetical protein